MMNFDGQAPAPGFRIEHPINSWYDMLQIDWWWMNHTMFYDGTSMHCDEK